jgi:hypothetical protein
MGMGAGQQQQQQQQQLQQQPSVGMQGKGGAARPAQQPAAGMGGKGVGQQPPQQSNLNNALTALGGTPTYPFPQPPVQQPVQGMAGKGVGQLPPQAQPRTQQDADFMAQQAFNQMQSGMGGKGVGTRQLDPAMQPYVNAAIGQPVQDLMAQRAAFDAANPQPVNDPNDPYAARFGVPGNYVGTPTNPAAGMGGKGVGGQLPPQAGTLNEALMGLNQPPVQVQPAPVQPAPVQPATGMSGKGALRSAAKTPQPVRAEQQKVATQRLLQQLASRNRGRGRR